MVATEKLLPRVKDVAVHLFCLLEIARVVQHRGKVVFCFRDFQRVDGPPHFANGKGPAEDRGRLVVFAKSPKCPANRFHQRGLDFGLTRKFCFDTVGTPSEQLAGGEIGVRPRESARAGELQVILS